MKIEFIFEDHTLIIPLKTNGIPIKFGYDLYSNRLDSSEGFLEFKNLVITNRNLKKEDFENMIKCRLNYKDLKFNIEFYDYIIKDINSEVMSIEFNIRFIFRLYHEYLFYLKMITNSEPPLIMDLRFNTPPYCNLKCPYCSNHINEIPFRYNLNYESARYFIQTIINSVDNFYFPEPKRFRFCGGEPYMIWDKYLEVEEFAKTFKVNNVTGYLGITNGIANMDKLLEWIKEASQTERYKVFELHFSNETMDVENNTKLNTPELLNKWKENVIKFGEEFKNKDNINLCIEIFHKSLDEDIELINFASDNNFKIYGVSHDQTSNDSKYIKETGDLFNKEIYPKFKSIKRRDRNLIHGLTSRFMILDKDDVLFEMKIINKLNREYNTFYYDN